MMMDFEKFFEEKEIPYQAWDIEYKGVSHWIDTETVIEAIKSTKEPERSKIAGMIFKLDFNNAPILPYLKFLAECMIKQNS